MSANAELDIGARVRGDLEGFLAPVGCEGVQLLADVRSSVAEGEVVQVERASMEHPGGVDPVGSVSTEFVLPEPGPDVRRPRRVLDVVAVVLEDLPVIMSDERKEERREEKKRSEQWV